MNKKLILHIIMISLMASPLMGLPNNRYTKFYNEPEITENFVKEEKKSNFKYILGVISSGLIAGLGYLGYKYYRNQTLKYIKNESLLDEPQVHLSELATPKKLEEPFLNNNNNHINKALNISFGDNKTEKTEVKTYPINTLDKKLQLLSKATSEAQEAMNILKEIADENNLPSDHDILKFAEEIYYKKPKQNPEHPNEVAYEHQIGKEDLQNFSEEDREDILSCLTLLLRCMKNRESAFQGICNANKKYTQNKVHKKFVRRKVNTDFFIPLEK